MINIKKTRRIYNELVLQLRNKNPKRRVKAKLRDDRQEAVGPNDVWAMDFVHDQLALGNKLRILTIVGHAFPFLSSSRPALHLPRRGCGPDTGTGLCPGRLSQDDPGRQWQRIYLARSRPVGLRQRCHPGLLTPWKADRQWLHRGVQQQAPVRMPERALVHEPCGHAGKTGDLALALQ